MVLRSLALFALVGTSVSATSPKAVSLTTADLPRGFSLTVGMGPNFNAWAEAVDVPAGQLTSHGFRSAYLQAYLRKSDLSEVNVSVSAYSTAAGAQWELKQSIKLDLKGKVKISGPSIGTQSVILRDKSKTTYHVDFRQGKFDNVVGITSTSHKLTVNDAIRLARLTAKRESH
jgi:hypothetical protein